MDEQNTVAKPDVEGKHNGNHHVEDIGKMRSIFLLISVMFTIGLIDAAASLKAPFYTAMAKSKGVPSSGYGLAMSATHVTILLTSLPIANKVYLYGAKNILIVGLILEAIGNAALGSIEVISNYGIFILVSAAAQAIEGLGQTMTYVSSFSAVVSLFSDSSSEIISKIEFSGSVGMVLGPFLGSIILTNTNFMITCAILAATILAFVPSTSLLMPVLKTSNARAPNDRHKILQILTLPKVWLPIVVLIASTINAGFSSVAIEPHLEQFHLSKVNIGIIFSMSTLTYCLSVLVYGKLCGRGVSEFSCVLSGFVLQIIGMGMVGPLPWIPVNSSLPISISGIMLGAAGNAGTIIPSFIFMQKVPPATSFSAEVDVNSLVSAIFQSALSLGFIIGTVVGGVIFSYLNFRKSQFVFWVLFVVLLFILIYFRCMHKDILTSTSKKSGSLQDIPERECLSQKSGKD